MTSATSRLLQLLSLLQARRDWPGSVLADRLGISQRTVRRDVDRLREMGYNIQATMGPVGGYRMDAGDECPPLLFDDDQVIALAVALQAAAVTGAGIEEAAVRALATVRQVMPSRLRHRLDALNFTPVPGGPGDEPTRFVQPETLLAISAANRAQEVLRFAYARRAGEVQEPAPRHRVEPHHLVVSRGRWYLVAWSLDQDEWRIFRADRITPSIPTGPRFARREVPGGDVAEYISARFKGSSEHNRWPCTGKVILHLPAKSVVPFAGDGVVEVLSDGRCSLEAGSWSWVALAAALCRFDCEISVVGPPELAQAFAVLAERSAVAARTPQTQGSSRASV
ncbi:YafY family protein [Leucobacter sp. wl10]|uniref:helix-turn-helix transcriptional regulator n=1 Tax=Leucobacter sp. wl10 TaxID=2304677 RepID=UPI000E5BADA3|nr:WYL domain-containing protein [Leucobacter sp. wl10]RGE19325.1 WYL domain-containing transcriptional regulator [Leucobacter sp. wl10]